VADAQAHTSGGEGPVRVGPSPERTADDKPAWLFEGDNQMRCRCDFCPALAPWAHGADAAESLAIEAGWARETDDELDADGNLVCRTVTWLCPACKA
jgi:hypothetical protein